MTTTLANRIGVGLALDRSRSLQDGAMLLILAAGTGLMLVLPTGQLLLLAGAVI